MPDPDFSRLTDPELLLALVLHGLRVRDDALNAAAAEFLSRQGVRPAGWLIREATSRRNSPPHRVRLLAAVERLDGLSGPDDWLDLVVLAADKNPRVRVAAGRCVVRHSTAPGPLPRPDTVSAGGGPNNAFGATATPVGRTGLER